MRRWTTVAFAAAIVSLTSAAVAEATHYAAWAPAQKADEIAGNSPELNTPSLDGCPIQSPDGLSMYLASNRPGGHGGLDIWVARRASPDAPYGAPENVGAPINSAADDFCPTPVRGGGLFFVSRQVTMESCGLGDVYFAPLQPGTRLGDPRSPGVCSQRAEQRARRARPVVRGDRRALVPLLLAELGERPR